jgi:O-antigen/teichoic acid export membrane protein
MQTQKPIVIHGRSIRPLAQVGLTAAISQLLVMIQSFLLARFLGPEKYGFISAALAIATLTSILVDWGMDTWLLHKGSLSEQKNDLASQVFTIKLVMSLFWALLLLLIAPQIRPTIYLTPILGLTIVAVAFDALGKTAYTLFFITDRFKESSLILVTSRIGRLLGTIVLIATGTTNPTHFLLLRVIIDLCFFVLLIIRSGIILNYTNSRNLVNTYKKALPYGYSEVISTTYNQSDLNLVSFFTSDLHVISYFSIAINIVNAIFAVVQTLQNVIIPKLAINFEKDKDRFVQNSKLVITGFLMIGLMTWIALRFFGADLIDKTLGKQYSTAFQYLRDLSGIFIVRSLVIALTSLLISTNNQTKRLIPQIVAAIAKIVLGGWIISRIGAIGLPYPYLISEALLALGLGYVCLRWVWKLRKIVGYHA